jgi:hypothetical protein
MLEELNERADMRPVMGARAREELAGAGGEVTLKGTLAIHGGSTS